MPERKRTNNRSFEIIFNAGSTDIPTLKAGLCDAKHGIYKAFFYPHLGTGDSPNHVHVGLVLREETPNLYMDMQYKYFTVGKFKPKLVAFLKCRKKCFKAKLQQYYNYCNSTESHAGEELGTPVFHKWKPSTKAEQAQSGNPKDFIRELIFDGLTVEQLEAQLLVKEWNIKIRGEALANFDSYEKMIQKMREVRQRETDRLEYARVQEEYRPFQVELKELLDKPRDDRVISALIDDGKTGKNWFVDKESLRQDTLVLQSGKSKDIAYAWNPEKHKRIIFDIPRGDMEYLNTSAIEKLKNGTFFSAKWKSQLKKSVFKPSILVLGNETIDVQTWTEDRLDLYTTTNKGPNAYVLRSVKSDQDVSNLNAIDKFQSDFKLLGNDAAIVTVIDGTKNWGNKIPKEE